MLFLFRMIFTLGNDRLFASVENILNKENILYVRHVKHAARRPHVVWPSWQHKCDPYGPRFDVPGLLYYRW
jgi:hypothetical protein